MGEDGRGVEGRGDLLRLAIAAEETGTLMLCAWDEEEMRSGGIAWDVARLERLWHLPAYVRNTWALLHSVWSNQRTSCFVMRAHAHTHSATEPSSAVRLSRARSPAIRPSLLTM